jgi:release factor glutamine methyltransferase
MKVRELVYEGRTRLAAASLQCADPLLHMKQIVEHCLGLDTSHLYRAWEEEVSEEGRRAVEAFLARRLTGEPFQYIAGFEWFWDAKFAVGPGVLIPRRETELVVEALLKEEARPRARVAELGAGSGNIGIAALRERPQWEWFGYEKNPESIPFLEANRKSLLSAETVYHVVPGDFFEAAQKAAPFDWIVSNAPYVSTGEMDTLAKEVRHEPRAALEAGPEGLDVIRRLVAEAPSLLGPGGGILGEMAAEQGSEVLKCLRDSGFTETRVIKDYAALDRVFVGRLGE